MFQFGKMVKLVFCSVAIFQKGECLSDYAATTIQYMSDVQECARGVIGGAPMSVASVLYEDASVYGGTIDSLTLDQQVNVTAAATDLRKNCLGEDKCSTPECTGDEGSKYKKLVELIYGLACKIIEYMNIVRDCVVDVVGAEDARFLSNATTLGAIPGDFAAAIDAFSAEQRDHIFDLAKKMYDSCAGMDKCNTPECTSPDPWIKSQYLTLVVRIRMDTELYKFFEMLEKDAEAKDLTQAETEEEVVQKADRFIQLIQQEVDLMVAQHGNELITDSIIQTMKVVYNCAKHSTTSAQFSEGLANTPPEDYYQRIAGLTTEEKQKVLDLAQAVNSACDGEKCASQECTGSIRSRYISLVAKLYLTTGRIYTLLSDYLRYRSPKPTDAELGIFTEAALLESVAAIELQSLAEQQRLEAVAEIMQQVACVDQWGSKYFGCDDYYKHFVAKPSGAPIPERCPLAPEPIPA